MSKFWRIGSKGDTLAYTVAAPNWETANAIVERLVGPQNPSNRTIKELPSMPPGYKLSGSPPCLLEEDPEAEE